MALVARAEFWLAVALAACAGSAIAGYTARSAAARARWWHDRSSCPQCGRVLGLVELVPILGWLVLRGRCRGCGRPIAAWYPLIEATAVAAAALAFALLSQPAAWLALGLALWLLLLAAFDLRTMRLPDRFTIPLGAAGLALAGLAPGLAGAVPPSLREALLAGLLAGAALGGLAWLYRRWRGQIGLGGGDIVLFAAAGTWVGPERLPELLLIAALLGIAAAVARGALRRRRRVPFGPALALATWLVWLIAAAGGPPLGLSY